MKRCIAALAPLALAVLLLGITGCEGDEGPAGPQGPPGVGLETCMQCHTDDYQMENYIVSIQTEYRASQHANAETFVRRGEDCARCHTSEGYQYFVTTGTTQAVTESSPVNCFACHSPHTNGDFALRKSGATTLDAGGTYDKGNSNTCAMCHQARAADPPITETGTAITSARWGPHHGPQGSILSGNSAWDFGTPLSTSASHNDRIAAGCVGCHMAETADNGLAGGHTFGLTYIYHGAEELNSKGCAIETCHQSWDDETAHTAVEASKAAFMTDLMALGDDLRTLGWMDESDLVVPAALPAEADARGAVWNYLMLLEDRSGGIHNPTYARAALNAAQAYVDAQTAQ